MLPISSLLRFDMSKTRNEMLPVKNKDDKLYILTAFIGISTPEPVWNQGVGLCKRMSLMF